MLDILEDYLRERRFGYQRIDGNVGARHNPKCFFRGWHS